MPRFSFLEAAFTVHYLSDAALSKVIAWTRPRVVLASLNENLLIFVIFVYKMKTFLWDLAPSTLQLDQETRGKAILPMSFLTHCVLDCSRFFWYWPALALFSRQAEFSEDVIEQIQYTDWHPLCGRKGGGARHLSWTWAASIFFSVSLILCDKKNCLTPHLLRTKKGDKSFIWRNMVEIELVICGK